ncbi:hypothetical protein HGB47_17735 [Leptospira yasudae]|uniref:DUF7424 family protein n=1 Tax=Leptospira yasudae TaxID=2202201 RepID=UPI001C4FC4B3|nr:hypothetical protein [Leptospira yasudae]MBW0435453.1 hypothetical protein [Leptospira yasudae]
MMTIKLESKKKIANYTFKCVLFLAIFLTLLCKYKIVSDLYLSEIIKIATTKGDSEYFANSELKFGVSSHDKCEEDKEHLTETLGNYFHDISNIQCSKEDFENYFQASVKIPIVRATESQFTSIPGLLNITVTPGEKIQVGLYLSPEHFNSLKETIKEKYWNTINIDEFSLGLIIINDTKEKIKLTAASVYVGKKPIPGTSEFELKSKSKTTILLSNVLKDYIFENSTSSFLSFDGKLKASK